MPKRKRNKRRNKKLARDAWVNQTKRKLLRQATRAEAALQAKMIDAKVKHEFQREFVAKRWRGKTRIYFADFYLPSPSLAIIEVDGEYHAAPEQQAKDRTRDDYFRNRLGLTVLRITNEQAITLPWQDIAVMLHEARKKTRNHVQDAPVKHKRVRAR